MATSYGLRKSKSRSLPILQLLVALVLICSVIFCGSKATQEVAAGLGYHASLGKPVYYYEQKPMYLPWQVLTWRSDFSSNSQIKAFIDDKLSNAQMIFVFINGPLLLVVAIFRRRLRGRDDLHGSAHWATETEIKAMQLLNPKTGVCLGRMYSESMLENMRNSLSPGKKMCFMDFGKSKVLIHDGPEHVLAFAPTRSGKGVSLIIPTLFRWLESTLVLDIKGENWAMTSGYRKSLGHSCMKFEPTDITEESVKYNPLQEIRLDSPNAIPDTQALALMLVDNDEGGKPSDPHWTNSAMSLLGGVIMHGMCKKLAANPEAPCSLHDIDLMLSDPDKNTEELLNEMLEEDHAALLSEALHLPEAWGKNIHTFIGTCARDMLNRPEKERGSVVSTAVTKLSLYRDPVIAANTSRSDFRISDLMNAENPVALYLVLSPAHVGRLKPLIRVMLSQIIDRLTEKMEFGGSKGYKHRLLLMLDELPVLGKLASLERALAYMAGYGIKCFLIVQSLSQLNGAYGRENSIMDNCHVRIAFAPNTPQGGKDLSDLTGKTTIVDQKISYSGSRTNLKNASVSVAETGRALLTPDECMRLPGLLKDGRGRTWPGHMLIFIAGQPPIYGKQHLWFWCSTMRKQVALGAAVSRGIYQTAQKASSANSVSIQNEAKEVRGYADYLG